MTEPKLILLISGKRKSGKDYLSEHLFQRLGPTQSEIIHISEPIKSHWAKLKGLDLKELLSDGPYKEQYRKEMIMWSDEVRQETPSFFCREAYEKATKPVVIVSDIRRRSDIAYFNSLRAKVDFVKTVRIKVDNAIRLSRGWTFQSGIDDVASECDLDDVHDWDYEIINENGKSPDELLQDVMAFITPILEEETQL